MSAAAAAPAPSTAAGTATAGRRLVTLGPRVVSFGADGDPGAFLKPLRDSTPLVREDDWAAVRARLANDGYLFLQGGLLSEDVDAARLRVLRHFAELGASRASGNGVEGAVGGGVAPAAAGAAAPDVEMAAPAAPAAPERQVILDPSSPLEDGVLAPKCGLGCVPFMEGRNPVTHSPELLRVFEGDALRGIFQGIFGSSDVRSFDFKWLRAVPREKFTGAHVDSVYMSRGSDRLLTTWIPFGHNPLERGGLCICEGSHRLESFAPLRATYGRMDHERDGLAGSGWFSHDPLEISKLFGPCTWRSADFEPGDVLIFTMQTVHMSTTNVTNFARISADVRWQPASERIDTRYVGSEGGGSMDAFLKHMTISGGWKAEGKVGDARKMLGQDCDDDTAEEPDAQQQQQHQQEEEEEEDDDEEEEDEDEEDEDEDEEEDEEDEEEGGGGAPSGGADAPAPHLPPATATVAGRPADPAVPTGGGDVSIVELRARWGFPVSPEAAKTLT